MKLLVRHIVIIAVILGVARADNREDRVAIQKSIVNVVTRSFDPKHPPSDMPPLHGDEAAVTVSEFSMETDAGASVVYKTQTYRGAEAEVKIERVTLKPKLHITIWLPNHPTQRLVDHENGHRKIAEIYYEKIDAAGKQYGSAIIGKHYQGYGNDTAAAVSDAIKRAIKEVTAPVMTNVQKVCSNVQDRYDRITDHGRREIAPEEAIKRAIKEVEQLKP